MQSLPFKIIFVVIFVAVFVIVIIITITAIGIIINRTSTTLLMPVTVFNQRRQWSELKDI